MLSPAEEVEPEARRFLIAGVIGQGAHGRVYRARMEAAGGFVREVALKLLKDDVVSEELLARFRDEARILGLVRDRAVVSVEPPVRLQGRWGILLEYVEGASAQRLLKAGGPLPPTVALEIVQELARVLDKLWSLEGPDGARLELLHRDLKPSNVQITPHGEVKLLDFGVARARFHARETQTVTSVAGTLGFIAPERVKGQEGPWSEIYSLGVVLHVLVTGDSPLSLVAEDPARSPEVARAVALGARLRVDDPARRPSAREVEGACERLRAELPGPTLRAWAETAVPAARRTHADDELVGTELTESESTIGARRVAIPLWMAIGGTVVGLAAAFLGIALAVGSLYLSLHPPTAREAAPEPGASAVEAAPVEAPPPSEPAGGDPSEGLLEPEVAPDRPVAAPVAPAPERPPRSEVPTPEAPVPLGPAARHGPPEGPCQGPPGELLGYVNVKLFTLGKGGTWLPQGTRPVVADHPREGNGFVASQEVMCTLTPADRVRLVHPVIRVPKQGTWIPIVGGAVRRD